MSDRNSHVLPLYDRHGNLHSITISSELWNRVSRKVAPILENALDAMYPPVEVAEPLDDWESFKEFWDFRYPFNAEVQCNCCGVKTEDWEHDEAKPFRLTNANLGGLLVFRCKACGATVRKKHFKDHICYEHTPCGS